MSEIFDQQQSKMVVGVFSTLQSADAAVTNLEAQGIEHDRITVISASDVVKRHFQEYRPEAEPDDWKSAAALGGSAGALLAGVGSVAALATGAGIPIIVAGGLASFITGGVVGGLAGVMTERGIETEAADYFEVAVADGKTLVAVDMNEASTEVARIHDSLRAAGAEPVTLDKNPDFSSE